MSKVPSLSKVKNQKDHLINLEKKNGVKQSSLPVSPVP